MSDRLSPNHERLEVERVSRLTNDELVNETVSAAAGDDWDGDFTRNGSVTFDVLRHELGARLSHSGFVTRPDFWE